MPITVPPTVDFDAANGKQLALIRIAFLAVFVRRSKLVIFMSDQFGKNFDQMAEGDDLEDQVFNLLRDARAEGWLGELVAKAIEVYANAAALKNMMDQWFLFADAPPAPPQVQRPAGARDGSTESFQLQHPFRGQRVGGGGPAERSVDSFAKSSVERSSPTVVPPRRLLIEAMMNDVHGPAAAQHWLERLASMRRRVCRIADDKNQIYTGFLVGPDQVLTVGRIGDVGLKLSEGLTTAKFDFEMIEGRIQEGPLLQVRQTEVFLDGAAAPSTSEELLLESAPVWFALLQLAEMEGARLDRNGTPRGWFDLNAAVTSFSPEDPLFLFHHPLGNYMQMSQASLLRIETSSRLRFEGETQPGSSGAPLFDQNFRLVGLHEGRLGSWGAVGRVDKIALRADAVAKVLRASNRLPPPFVKPAGEPAPVEE